ncbi:MAG: Veg family protein [Synergistaceae bacterium]
MVHTIDSIKELVLQHKGSMVNCRVTNGRRKMEERVGVIKETYPSLFTVYVEDQNAMVSFSYADVLTHEVELQIVSTGEALI